MVVPDFALICEIMLVAEGFQEARILARKFITLYTLCKELLSKQDHYDWGLRAIKSVLVVAGTLKVNKIEFTLFVLRMQTNQYILIPEKIKSIEKRSTTTRRTNLNESFTRFQHSENYHRRYTSVHGFNW